MAVEDRNRSEPADDARGNDSDGDAAHAPVTAPEDAAATDEPTPGMYAPPSSPSAGGAVDEPDLSGDREGAPASSADFGVRLTWPGAEASPPSATAPPASAGRLAPREESTRSDLGTPGSDRSDPGPFGSAMFPATTSEGSQGGEERNVIGSAAGPSRPALVAPGAVVRVETFPSAMQALALRVEALASGTAGMRAALGDRLNDHAETIGRLVRSQAADAQEQQRSTERSLSELLRTVSDSDESLHLIAARFDGLDARLEELGGLISRHIDTGRDLAVASDKLSRQVIDGLETFGDRLLERLDESDASLAAEIGAGRAETARVRKMVAEGGGTSTGRTSGGTDRVAVALGQIHDDIGGLASLSLDPDVLVEELGTIRDEIAGLRREVAVTPAHADGVGVPLAAELADLRAMVTAVHDRQRSLSEAAQGLLELRDAIELVPDDGGDDAEHSRTATGSALVDLDTLDADLSAMRTELVELRRAAATLEAEVTAWRADAAAGDVDPGQLGHEIAELRQLIEASGSNKGLMSVRRDLAELREGVVTLAQGYGASASGQAGAADDQGLEAVRAELAALRRRLNLRARPAPVTLDDEQIGRLADAVTDRLRRVLDLDPPR